MGEVRRCAVIGSPIGHSLSPVLHRAGYAAVGLTGWDYGACDVTVEGLPAFLAGLDPAWRGLSVTMPLKRAIVPLLDDLSDRAGQAHVVNTVLLTGGRRLGCNTDIGGAVAAMSERMPTAPRRAMVVGGGATAASVVLALADLGCLEVTLVVREEARAQGVVAVAARHPGRPTVTVTTMGGVGGADGVRGAFDIVVSTVPVVAQTPDLLALADLAPVIFDVLYDPWPTPLAALAGAEGKVLVSGLDLLVHQAAEQLTLMTGVEPAPLAQMRAAGALALAARG